MPRAARPTGKATGRRFATPGCVYLERASRRIPHDWDSMTLNALWQLFNSQRPTPQTTIEAIMYCVRTGGAKALHEPANIERLSRCDDAALAQIDARLTKLKESGQCQ